MRTVLLMITFIIIAIISIPLYLVEFIIGHFNTRLKHAFAQRIVSWIFKLWLFISGTDYTIYGLEKIPTDEPVLYAANHRSFYDVFLGYAYVPTLTSFIAKKSIKKIPCVAQWMNCMQCFFLDRDDIKSGLQMIKDSIKIVQDGYSIFISPEGTRHAGDELLPFKEGSFKIATRTNCKIIPVCYTNTENIFEKHLPWIHKASVTVEFGDPIDISGMDRDERRFLGAKTRDIIQKMYNERRNS